MSYHGVIAIGFILGSVLLSVAPDKVSGRAQALVADLCRPGQEVARCGGEWLRDTLTATASRTERSRRRELERLRAQLAEQQARTAALQIQLARSAERQQHTSALPAVLRNLPPLTLTSLVPARILGEVAADRWRHAKQLDRGDGDGIEESDLVISGDRSLIDLGQDASLSPEDPLLLGRCVIGKVERVGRWSSTILMLTDAKYRGRAQLVHEAGTGYVFGARGILEGQGTELCRLTGVRSTESVTVGDAVYTTRQDGADSPLLYGHVVEARLGESDQEWTVLVRPVALPGELTDVQILRTSIQPERLSAAL